MNYQSEYIQEVIGQFWEEVKVHGAQEVAERLGVSESCVRELAPEEAKRWDEAKAAEIEDKHKRGSGLGLAPYQQR